MSGDFRLFRALRYGARAGLSLGLKSGIAD